MQGRIVTLVLSAVLLAGIAVAQVAQQAPAANQQQTAAQDVKQPVVEGIGQHFARIAWGTNVRTGGKLTVRYGTDPNNLTQTVTSPAEGDQGAHRVTLKNLERNTTYYFQAVSSDGMQSEVGQFMTTSFAADKIPIYRAFSDQTQDHFYTTNFEEWRRATTQGGFRAEGIAGYILEDGEAPNAVALQRFVNPSTGDHFYTTNENERQRLSDPNSGYRHEGIAGYVLSQPAAGTVPLLRMVHPGRNDHFYTTSQNERQQALQNGYQDEGQVGFVWEN